MEFALFFSNHTVHARPLLHAFGVSQRSPSSRSKRTPLRFFSSAIFAAIAAAHAHAQFKVEPIIVTATRSTEALAETLRDATVLRGDDLLFAGVNDLATALQSAAGLEVQTLGAGATPSIFVRGGNANQVLVLLDGQRVGSSFNGLSALQHVPIALIDRIEIVRGPAASLYGADAVSGVMHIFTKKGAAHTASALVGEQHSSDLSARAGHASADNAFSVAINHRQSRGFNAIIDANNFSYNPDRDGYRFTSAQVNGAVAISPALKLEANALVARGDSQYDGSATFDDRIKSNLRNLGATLRFAPSPRWVSALSLGQGVDESQFVSDFPGHFNSAQNQASWQNNFQMNPDVSFWNAVEARREKISTLDNFAVDSRRTTSFAFGGEAKVTALKVAGSLRIDNSNQYNTRTTGSLALGYGIGREWRVIANAGTSFKAPSFNDLYYPGFSNPNLSPERAKSIDLALQWSRGVSHTKLVVYENRVRDLIQFQCDANFNCAPQNVAQAALRGATISAATRWSPWRIEASLDVSDPKDASSGKRLARRAKIHGALKASGELFGVTTGVELIASGDRFDNATNTRRLAGYGLVNAFARHQLASGIAIGLRIDNAFDSSYQNSYGYANGGRRAWLTLAMHQK